MQRLSIMLLIGLIINTAQPQSFKNYRNLMSINPNVAQFHKLSHGEISNTGTVPINVKLTEFEGKTINIPVNLSYQTTGIKVHSIASRVGTNWSLMGGGMITRIQQGLFTDFTDNVRMDSPSGKDIYGYNVSNNKCSDTEPACWGDCDYQPDKYIISTPIVQSKFYFESNSKLVVTEGDDIYLEEYELDRVGRGQFHTEDGELYNQLKYDKQDIVSFTIGDFKGNKYYFEEYDKGPVPYALAYSINNWYLTKIVTAEGEKINYEYESGEDHTILINEYVASEFHWNCFENEIPDVDKNFTRGLHRLRLHKITNGNDSIKFYYNHDREDLEDDNEGNNVSPSALSAVKTFHKGNKIHESELYYDYTMWEGEESRLLLKKVKFPNDNLNVQDKEFEFEYYPGELPGYATQNGNSWNRISRNDFMDLYANHNQNTFEPKVWVHPDEEYDNMTEFYPFKYGDGHWANPGSGSLQRPVEKDAIKGMLRYIEYPNGGKKILEYELPYILGDVKGGLLRIKSQILIDDNMDVSHRKDYNYVKGEVILPKVAFGQGDETTAIFANSALNMDLINGSPIMYKMISETSKNGTIKRYYHAPEISDPNIFYDDDCYSEVNYNPASGWPFLESMNQNNHIKRGKLYQKWIYDENQNVKKIELSNYIFKEKDDNQITGLQTKCNMNARVYTEYTINPVRYLLKDKYILIPENDSQDITYTPGDHQLNEYASNSLDGFLVKRKNLIYSRWRDYHGVFYWKLRKNGSLKSTANNTSIDWRSKKTEYVFDKQDEEYEWLKQHGQMLLPAEVSEYEEEGALDDEIDDTEKLTDKTKYDYAFCDDERVRLSKISKLNTKTGELEPEVSFDEIPDDRDYDEYDHYGNLLQYTLLPGGKKVSYLWNEKHQTPVLKAENAGLHQIAYSNFEAGGTTFDQGWILYDNNTPTEDAQYTGKRSLLIENTGRAEYGPTIDLDLGDDYHTAYMAEAYVKGDNAKAFMHMEVKGNWDTHVRNMKELEANDWTRVHAEISRETLEEHYNSDSKLRVYVGLESGSKIYVDNFRVHPSSAFMKTASFDARDNALDVTDPGSKTQNFNYDDYDRLLTVRDGQRHVRKHHKYHWQEATDAYLTIVPESLSLSFTEVGQRQALHVFAPVNQSWDITNVADLPLDFSISGGTGDEVVFITSEGYYEGTGQVTITLNNTDVSKDIAIDMPFDSWPSLTVTPNPVVFDQPYSTKTVSIDTGEDTQWEIEPQTELPMTIIPTSGTGPGEVNLTLKGDPNTNSATLAISFPEYPQQEEVSLELNFDF